MRIVAGVATGGLAGWSLQLVAHPSVIVVGVAGAVCVAAALTTRFAWFGVVAAVLLSAQYALALQLSDFVVDVGAPFVGVGLLLVLEGTDLSRGRRVRAAPAVHRARRTFILATCAAGAGLGALALTAGTLVRGSGAPLFLAGISAGIGLLYLVTLLARGRPAGG